MERIIGYIRTHFNLSNIYNLELYKRLVKYIVLLTVLIIFIVIKTSTSVLDQNTLSINITTDTNKTQPKKISPADIFHPHIAIIVDFRIADHIISVIHNVNYNIPASWPIQIFHGKENEGFLRNSTLQPLIESGKAFFTLMDEVFDRARTDTLLTTPNFWKRVRGEKVLLFQIDSAMCSSSPHKVTDFLQYDYVGAPWDLSFFIFDRKYRVGNGGFSLRSRSKLLALLELIPYDNKFPEDVWYAQNLHKVNGSIPSVEIAQTFAVESMYYPRPVGIHRFPWHCQFRADLARTCPESMMAMPDFCRF